MTVHPFPTCFACGPAREQGDGLRLFAGRIPGTETFAAPWVPKEVDDEIVWAALDCPSCAVIYLDEDHPPPHVLGRVAARVDRLPEVGDRHVVMSWLLRRDGRGKVDPRPRSSTTATGEVFAVAARHLDPPRGDAVDGNHVHDLGLTLAAIAAETVLSPSSWSRRRNAWRERA